MRRVCAWLLSALCVLAPPVLPSTTGAQAPALASQLDRYLSGQYDGVVNEIAATADFGHLLETLKREAPPWIDAAPEAQRPRRRLVAAAYALEAARAAEHEDWKLLRRMQLNAPTGSPIPMIGGGQSSETHAQIYWKPPAQLLEWGCELLRGSPAPAFGERWWQLAALSVAQRRGDYEFLIGSPWDARDNPDDEIDHLKHVIARFPKEARFALGQAIAIEWRTWPTSLRRPRGASRNLTDALRAFEGMRDDADVGAEARLRSGVLLFRSNSYDRAAAMLDRVEAVTRDRYLTYLAKYFRGQAYERRQLPIEAERDYRGALATIPKAISATMALAALLTRAERPGEASALVDAALTAAPPVVDPWRTYAAADDRFWPQFIAQVRAEIRQ